ncbi:MAG: hypothetical protein FD180_2965 [Planctomycetota bacterium]|nr:MAG: hypothetical protein FD180_2965 [Planctomycetota bacterium]
MRPGTREAKGGERLKRRGKKHEVPDAPEPVHVEPEGEPGFSLPRNWSEEEIFDAMKAFEDQIRRERGLPPGEDPAASR